MAIYSSINSQPTTARLRWMLVRRATQMVWKVLPLALVFLRDHRRFLLFGSSRTVSQAEHQRRAERIKRHIESLGTAFIKLGQIVSARADLIPEIYLNEIAKLQDGIRPMPGKKARRTLEKEYGVKLEKIFDKFDENALAAASVAQVHFAVWKGQDVAVKFVRPDIPMQMAADLIIARMVIRLLNEWINNTLTNMLATAISEGAKGMVLEIDLTNEQRNLEMMHDLLHNHPGIVVPRLFTEVSGPHVIVMEYCPGVKVTEEVRLQACGFDRRDIINRLVRVYAEMIFVEGVYHADPHPGNILIGDGAKVILLDYGMVCRLSKQTRDVILDAVASGLRGDREKVIDGLFAIKIVKPETDRSRIHAFIDELMDLHNNNLTTRNRLEQVGLLIERTARELDMSLPAELVYVFRSLSLLEGIATKLEPGWSLLEQGLEPMKEAVAAYYAESYIRSRGGFVNVAMEEFRRLLGHRTVRRFT